MAVHSGSGKSSAFLPTMSKIASRSCALIWSSFIPVVWPNVMYCAPCHLSPEVTGDIKRSDR